MKLNQFLSVGFLLLLTAEMTPVTADEIFPTSALILEGLQRQAGEQLPADPVQMLLARRGRQPLNVKAGDSVVGLTEQMSNGQRFLSIPKAGCRKKAVVHMVAMPL